MMVAGVAQTFSASARNFRSSLECGLSSRAPIKIPIAMMPISKASQVPAAASAAVPAQVIDENASAKVAMREEVCRRRKWLRLAWVRNQSWISVAEPAATMTPMAQTTRVNRRGARQSRR